MDGRQREVASRIPRIGVAGHAPLPAAPEPEQHERGIGDLEDRLGGLVQPDVRPQSTPEQADPGRWRETGRLADPVGRGRAGRRRPRLGEFATTVGRRRSPQR